ncbi:hypothetical protein EPYR_01565 [Erwinia pyrifoliae DSM 12163]|nr:hypothetical protein EPYR_01565 [Erwinia pyrifoliae DSM 12163]
MCTISEQWLKHSAGIDSQRDAAGHQILLFHRLSDGKFSYPYAPFFSGALIA